MPGNVLIQRVARQYSGDRSIRERRVGRVLKDACVKDEEVFDDLAQPGSKIIILWVRTRQDRTGATSSFPLNESGQVTGTPPNLLLEKDLSDEEVEEASKRLE